MKEYFATCDVQGPISVRIITNSLAEVLEQIKAEGQRWIDAFYCDAEDAFLDEEWDDNWENFSPEDVGEVLEELDYQKVYDSGIIGNWIVWTK